MKFSKCTKNFKLFPKGSELSQIFNKNAICFGCMPSVEKQMQTYNGKVLIETDKEGKILIAEIRIMCLLNGNCQIKDVVY